MREQSLAKDVDKLLPTMDERYQRPARHKKQQSPDNDKKQQPQEKQQPPTMHKKKQPFDNVENQQQPAKGEKQQLTANGGKQQPQAKGEKQQPQAKGGKQQPPAKGGKQQPTANSGKQQPTAKGGKQQPLAECWKLQLTAKEGKQQTPSVDGNQYWIKELCLFSSDRQILESPTMWVSDSIIYGASILLSQQAKDIDGWQTPQCGKHFKYRLVNPRERYAQVLHDTGHWITVSNIDVYQGGITDSVNVYDSYQSSNVSLNAKKQVCAMIQSSNHEVKFDIINIMPQPNFCDCGVFAIACARVGIWL